MKPEKKTKKEKGVKETVPADTMKGTTTTQKTVEDLHRQEVRKLELKGRRAVSKSFNTLQSLEIEYVTPDSIYPNAYNPNRQSEREFELLCSSMLEDGFTTPVLVHKATREIVDGEHRWRAAQQLGLKEIPVVFVDMTNEQMRISTLRHNRARGAEDIEMTVKILQDLRELGALDHAVDSLGISDREMAGLLDDLPAPEALAAETYSDSWVPAPDEVTEGEEDFKGRKTSISPGMKAAQARLTEKVNGAASEEERQVLMKSRDHVPQKVVVMLTGSDVVEFKAMFPDRETERIIALCQFHVESGSVCPIIN